MKRNKYGRTAEVTVRENSEAAQGNGLAEYETVHLTEYDEIAWGAHFGGHAHEAEVMNRAGLLGLRWEESENHHDSNYHYFSGKVEEIYPKFEKFLMEALGGIKEHPKYGR